MGNQNNPDNFHHYAWKIFLACTLMIFIAMGLCLNVYTIYHPFVLQKGLTNAEGSLVITSRAVMTVAATFFATRLFRVIGVRKTVAVGFACEVLSRILFALAGTFPEFLAAAALGGIAYAWSGVTPISILINRWFHARAGAALGLSSTGSGICSVVMCPVVSSWILKYGMRQAFLREAFLTAVLGFAAVLLIRNFPEDIGVRPYGEGQKDEAAVRGGASQISSGKKSVNITGVYWGAFLAAAFLLAAPTSPGYAHLTVLFKEGGYSTEQGAFFVALFGAVLIFGKMLCGMMADQLGSVLTTIVFGFFCTAGVLVCSLIHMHSILIPLTGIIFVGMGFSVVGVLVPVWVRNFKSPEAYDTAITRTNLLYSIGCLAFGPVPGILADYTGSYAPAYMMFTVCSVISFLIVSLLYRKI